MTIRKLPSKRNSKAKVELILKTAATLFAKKGFEATTTRDIAEVAEIPIGSIYQYFENKKDIMYTVAGEYGSTIDKFFLELSTLPLPPNIKPEEIAQFVTDRVLSFDEANPELLMSFGFSHINSDLFGAIEQLDKKIVEYLANFIDRLKPGFDLATNYSQLLVQWKGAVFLVIKYKQSREMVEKESLYQAIVQHLSMYYTHFLSIT